MPESEEGTGPTHDRWRNLAARVALGVVAIAVAFFVGRWWPDASAHDPADLSEQDQVWTCSMDPQVRQSEPGQCPICGMDLVRLGEDADPGRVVLSPRARALARIQTVEVSRASAPLTDVHLLGRIALDENRVRNVSAWVAGRVDKLSVRETGAEIKRGQSVAKIYSPEVYSAHQDLIAAAKQVQRLSGSSESAKSTAHSVLESARERLSLLGLKDSEIDRMQSAKKAEKTVPIRASVAGTVTERLVTQGEYVETGSVLYRTAQLDRLWVELDAYESDLPALAEGQTVEISVPALPGETFSGEVSFIDPVLDPRLRVSNVRVEIGNEEGKLRPGMFVEGRVRGASEDAETQKQRFLVVPDTAPLFTGKRSVVYVEVEGSARPTYEPRAVELGPRMGDQYPVLSGLEEGDRVVIAGAFALDADLQLRGGPSMMAQPDDRSRGPLGDPIELSAATKTALAPVVVAYLSIQEALADDDLSRAVDGGQSLVSALEAVELDGEAERAWASVAPRLDSRAHQVADATAIEGARTAFRHLSLLVHDVLQVIGNPLDHPIRAAYCPMADDNHGATWFQRGSVVDNSYFGETMLSCGEIRQTIDPGEHLLTLVSPGNQAQGHQH